MHSLGRLYDITDESSKGFCGTYPPSNTAAQISDFCVPGLTTTIVPLTNAPGCAIFPHETGLEALCTLLDFTAFFFCRNHQDAMNTYHEWTLKPSTNWEDLHISCSHLVHFKVEKIYQEIT